VGSERAVVDRPRYERDTVEFARAFTFFDAVYAFALTLLVVNIDPPSAVDWTSLPALLASGLEWQLFGFAGSFAVIAVFWRVNHRIVSGFHAVTPSPSWCSSRSPRRASATRARRMLPSRWPSTP
jgi:uncharacterized membrane protein